MLFAADTASQTLAFWVFLGLVFLGIYRTAQAVGGNSPVASAGRQAAAKGILRLFK